MKEDKKKTVIELVSHGETPDNTIYYISRNGMMLKNSVTHSEAVAMMFYRREIALKRGDLFTTKVLQSTEI